MSNIVSLNEYKLANAKKQYEAAFKLAWATYDTACVAATEATYKDIAAYRDTATLDASWDIARVARDASLADALAYYDKNRSKPKP